MTTKHLFHFIRASLGVAASVGMLPAAGEHEHLVVNGFQTPESAIHDTIADIYLVSNVRPGNPAAIDHNGFISRVSPDGSIQDLRWIQDGVNGVTLNGPKEIWLHGRALYVADVDTLRIFDRNTGMPLREVPMPNPFAPSSLFLNDVVVADDGTVYVSDNRNSAIFVVDAEGRASLWAMGSVLGSPNALLLDYGNVGWVTFFRNEVKRVTRLGKIISEAILPSVNVSKLNLPEGALFLDGYCRHNGSLFVTSWVTGKVYRIRRSGMDVQIVAEFVSALDNPTGPAGPADINIDEFRNRLLVPLFNANQLVLIPLVD